MTEAWLAVSDFAFRNTNSDRDSFRDEIPMIVDMYYLCVVEFIMVESISIWMFFFLLKTALQSDNDT